MIRKKLLNFKLNLPFFVSDAELERFRDSAVPFRERCPHCGTRGKCRFFAVYGRSIVDIMDGRPCCRTMIVARVRCDCGHTHALLPDFIVPYRQYTLPFILHILKLYFSRSMTVQALCGSFWISPPTLYEWKHAFAMHRSCGGRPCSPSYRPTPIRRIAAGCLRDGKKSGARHTAS